MDSVLVGSSFYRVTFPMSELGAVINLLGALTDGHPVADTTGMNTPSVLVTTCFAAPDKILIQEAMLLVW